MKFDINEPIERQRNRECMEYSMKSGFDACQHSVVKYVSRFRDKGGISDLRKAIHALEMLIEFEEAK